jgi:hypothetical protein
VTQRRVLLAVLLVLLAVVAVVDAGWLPAAVLLLVLVIGVPVALRLLMQGQSEWFGREQDRRRRR